MSRAGDKQAQPLQHEIEAAEKDEFENGPLALLTKAVRQQTMVLINVRNNKKLLGRVKAFDRHCNMILENVREIWEEIPKGTGGKGQRIVKERVITKMFLRGDSVIIVMANPTGASSSKKDENNQMDA